MKTLLFKVSLAVASSASPGHASSVVPSGIWSKALSILEPLLGSVGTNGLYATSGPFAPVTPEILTSYISPVNEQLLRNSYVVRKGSNFYLGGKRWTTSGANVYWLGLDENVIPPNGQPFYAPFNASYPTRGRTVEVMNTLVTMGAHTIRSQTLGVSVGNPLSLEPELGVFNDEAFETIDWAVWQAREHGECMVVLSEK